MCCPKPYFIDKIVTVTCRKLTSCEYVNLAALVGPIWRRDAYDGEHDDIVIFPKMLQQKCSAV